MSAPPHITFLACLPRSRSAWCANLLTHGPSFAYHEPLRWAVKKNPLTPALSPGGGEGAAIPDWLELAKGTGAEYVTFCDTAFALYWKRALDLFPDARVLILWQGPEVCRQSWNKAVARSGQPSLHDHDGNGLYRMERELRQLEEYCLARSGIRLGHMRVKELDRMSGVQSLWDFCTWATEHAFAPKMDLQRARMLMDLDIQAILPRYIDDSGEQPGLRMIGSKTLNRETLNRETLNRETLASTRKGTPCL